ncbi:MAG: Gfo/Idh/MocA family oxidoreductase [Bacteroidota bacterium]
MKNTTNRTRRKFLKQSATAAIAFSIVPRYVLGGKHYIAPSDKTTIGFIGTGKQSVGLGKRFMNLDSIQMVAASDIDQQKLARFKKLTNTTYAEKMEKPNYEACKTFEAYEELLAQKDIDAVIIATPDHWHAKMSIEAMEAGKDVYCEKPLAHTVKEGRAMVKAAKKYKKILQTGSMQRSWEDFRHAVELVQNGYLGDIKTVKVNVGDPALEDNLPKENTPDYLDWDRWLGPAPQRGYSAELSPPIEVNIWPKWRDYKEYGGGILCDWGAHMFDIAQWGLAMDDSGPVEFIPPSDPKATRGMKYIYANGIEMYHEDFGRGWAVQFNGTEGKLEVSRSFLESDIEGLVETKIKKGEKRVYYSDNHYQDWIDAIKNRTQPICSAEVGHRSASICNLSNIVYQLGRPLQWNPKREKFKGDKEANKMLGKTYREGYAL